MRDSAPRTAALPLGDDPYLARLLRRLHRPHGLLDRGPRLHLPTPRCEALPPPRDPGFHFDLTRRFSPWPPSPPEDEA
jgi:hypothetical protein